MKNLPISIQTFEKIIEGGYLYVDKTHYLHQLINQGAYFFLSRPRRFGKSLLLTTLKSFFQGREDLFRGLFIHSQEKEWKQHPVVHIDYSFVEYRKDRATFEKSLHNHLVRIGNEYKIKLENTIIADAFIELVQKLHQQSDKVVILVDEYDKPLVDTLSNEEKFMENREVLRSLYGTMKGLDAYLRFVMLTGVSRFAKVNVFSGMKSTLCFHDLPRRCICGERRV
ncbi:MAG: AAA family ATPase [Phaeodactylibacter sp.]|nr:AAA family ATPase [Phaeodactylibacter sp.]